MLTPVQAFRQRIHGSEQVTLLSGPRRSQRPKPSPSPQSPLAVRFGIRLKTLRLQRGMTQMQLSVDFGIDRTFISDLERGRKSVSLPFIEVFAIGFGLSLSELLDQL